MMAAKEKCALTQSNLAVLGALDDFYEAYKQCIDKSVEIHENLVNSGKYRHPISILDPWCEEGRKQARKICDNLFVQYTYIFTKDFPKIHTNAYGFRNFDLFYTKKSTKKILTLVCSNVTFSEFLHEIFYAMLWIIHRRKTQTQPAYSFERVEREVNANINALVEQKRAECIIPHNDSSSLISGTELYIFERLSSTGCYKNEHPVVPAKYVASLMDQSGEIVLPTHFCNYCQKYFIGRKTLDLFEKNYGKMLIEKRKCTEDELGFDGFKPESRLHRFGYNVIDGGLSERERQNLLIQLMQSKKFDYLEISSTIEQNIQLFQNSPRHQLAVKKWKDDLKYIGQWIIDNKC